MQAEGARSVALFVARGKPVEVEQVRATHEAFDAIEDRVVRRGGGAAAIILIFAAEEFSERLPFLLVRFGKAVQPLHILQYVIAAVAHGPILVTQPYGPIALFKFPT